MPIALLRSQRSRRRAVGGVIVFSVVAMWSLLSGFGGCCPPGGSSTEDYGYYEIHIGYGEPSRPSQPWGGGVAWGEVINPPSRWVTPPVRDVWVVLPEGRVPAAPMIEVWRDGERVDVPASELHDIPEPPHGCGRFRGQRWELVDLAPGRYTIVHRRASAPDGVQLAYAPWTEVDGEERVEAVLLVPDGGEPDAGVGPDAP